jgi:hypothetical protein
MAVVNYFLHAFFVAIIHRLLLGCALTMAYTIEFIGLWELLNDPGFNSIEFDGFKTQAGSNSFSLTPKKWIEAGGRVFI